MSNIDKGIINVSGFTFTNVDFEYSAPLENYIHREPETCKYVWRKRPNYQKTTIIASNAICNYNVSINNNLILILETTGSHYIMKQYKGNFIKIPTQNQNGNYDFVFFGKLI
jgi:hypothetical protein